MKNFKKMATLGLALGIILTSSFPAFAKGQAVKNVTRPQYSSGVAEVGSSDTVVSEVMTFDQLVNRIAKDHNISISEATNQISANSPKDINKMATIALTGTYRTLTRSFYVNDIYQPSLNFYCQTSESGSFHGILTILDVSMNRSSGGMSKQFNGTVYSKLEDPNKIHFIVNGDFYNNGTTTYNGGVSIPVGGSATITFGVSYASNFYQYCYQAPDLIW